MKRSLRALALAVFLSAQVAEAAQVSLTWRDNSTNEDGFNIQRKVFTEPDSAYVQMGTTKPNITTFIDGTVAANVVYCYRVNAFNAAGVSPWSQPGCMLATPDGVVVVYTP